MKKILVIKGCLTTDELQGLGLPMAHRYSKADEVILIGDDGLGFVVKGGPSEGSLVEFYDASSLGPSPIVATMRGDGATSTS